MNKEMGSKFVPKLRFPDFEAAEWKLESLESVYSFKVTNSFTRDNLNYVDGDVKNIHYGDIHTKFNSSFNITKEKVPFVNKNISIDKISKENYCQEGDIIFADASEDKKDIGKSIEIVELNKEKLVSGLHTLHARQKTNRLIVGFGAYLFISDTVRKQIQREAQGAKVLGISATRLSSIKIAYPNNKKEQQKIADCLSSLDDLISAETRKLDALKGYKKGLMQQLFPAVGEKVPKLRFTEFADSGEWEERNLGSLIDIKGRIGYRGYTVQDIVRKGDGAISISPSNINYDGSLQFKKSTYISWEKYEQSPEIIIENNFVILVKTGSTYGKVGFVKNLEEKATINPQIVVLKPSNINPFFLFLLVSGFSVQEQINNTVVGGAIPTLSQDSIAKFKVFVPAIAEQQKIADCLSSLDEQITIQTQKIEDFKLHKKGLMQQLFPNVN